VSLAAAAGAEEAWWRDLIVPTMMATAATSKMRIGRQPE